MPDRRPYPTAVTGEVWAFVAPYLTLLPEAAGRAAGRLRARPPIVVAAVAQPVLTARLAGAASRPPGPPRCDNRPVPCFEVDILPPGAGPLRELAPTQGEPVLIVTRSFLGRPVRPHCVEALRGGRPVAPARRLSPARGHPHAPARDARAAKGTPVRIPAGLLRSLESGRLVERADESGGDAHAA